MVYRSSPMALVLNELAARPHLPLLSRVFLRAAYLITIWHLRSKTRRDLRKLPAHLLKDIGVTPDAAEIERNKRFWQP